jgi:predicted metal-dependent phosphoesterase TrpH
MLVRAKVDFQKPDIQALKKSGLTLVDMHFHTKYSDTYTPISKVLKKASMLGIGVAITDHNEIEGSIQAYKRKEDQLIIPGIEITCYERNHMLAYFSRIKDLEEFYYNYVGPYKIKNPYTVTRLKTGALLKATRDYDCLVSAAHPFLGFQGIYKSIQRRNVSPSLVSMLDAIEVMNGSLLKLMNWKAIQWAEHLGAGFTGGSDGHTLKELGTFLTYSKARSVRGFLNNIREQENYVIGRQIGLITQMNAKSRILSKHIKYIRPTLQVRYEVTVKPSVRYHVPRIRKKIKKVRQVSVERVRDVAKRSARRIDFNFERVGPGPHSRK